MRAAALLLLALLLAPLASAHIEDARPILQMGEGPRLVNIAPRGLGVSVELNVAADPLRHGILHQVDPAGAGFEVEHRQDPSQPQDRFFAHWSIERIVEYRDNNLNGQWEPSVDAPVKAWRPEHHRWRVGGLQDVQVADVTGQSALWHANLTASPDIRLEVVAAGQEFVDEGARVRPQDLAYYLDIKSLPPRELGSLYAIEARVIVDDATSLYLHEAEETPTALVADAPRRRALLVWGGEALLDGAEARLDADLREERVGEDGNRSALLVLHVPAAEREMHFVIVWGVEYLLDVKRGTPAAGGIVLLAIAAALPLRTGRRENG